MAKKEYLKLNLQRAVNGYVSALCKMWEMDMADGYWIGDEIGGVWDNGGLVTINLCDMVFCVENGITYKEFNEWMEYNFKCMHFKFDTMNLKSWHNGAPRVSQKTFDRLYGIENGLSEAINDVKSKQYGDSDEV